MKCQFVVYEMLICESHVSLFTFIYPMLWVRKRSMSNSLSQFTGSLKSYGFERSYGLSTKGGI